MSEPERAAYKAYVTRQLAEGLAFNEQEMLVFGILQSFTLFDILWVGLAVVTAFKLGAGQQIMSQAVEGQSHASEDHPTT
jgi:hypothetical protein